MVSESRIVEVTIMSASGLKKVRRFGKVQKCYVLAYIYAAQRQATHADPYGGVNPTWNTTLTLACYESHFLPGEVGSASSSSRSLTVDIYSHSNGMFHSGDKLVGTVVVPLQDILSDYKEEGMSLELDVRRPSGKAKGKLKMLVKLRAQRTLGEHEDPQMPTFAYGQADSSTSRYTASGPQSAYGYYPTGSNSQKMKSSAFGQGEVVTGYPAQGYAFAPLGAMPMGKPPLQFGANNNGYGRYVGPTPGMSRTQRQQRGGRRSDRRGRKKRMLKTGMLILGGVALALLIL